GAALAALLLVPVSLLVSGGASGYRSFVANTLKHEGTPLTNAMGLRTVVAYRPQEVGRLLVDNAQTDPWNRWKQARLRAFHQARPLYGLLIVAFLVMLGMAVRGRPVWEVAALGV